MVSALGGIAMAVIASAAGHGELAPLGAWDTTALIYVLWTWFSVWPMTPVATKSHAKQEAPGRTSTEILLIVASIASLVAVGFLIELASKNSGFIKGLDIFLGLASVVVSWSVVQTTYALKYARLFYGDPEGGIDFNDPEPPRYSDFAYLAFTLGMTFQVSDTALKTKELRATALKQSLLSYVFGTIIIATTINTIASLAK
jgi:uncharacterized membrane protein